MIKATYSDKETIVDILTESFSENKSVNYIINKSGVKDFRVRQLMSYSFEYCFFFGKFILIQQSPAAHC